MPVRRASLMALAALAAAGTAAAADDDTTATIVADQVRSQGFACAEPVTASKNEAESKPDLPVYLLTCGDATYRVELVPDQGAKITSVQ